MKKYSLILACAVATLFFGVAIAQSQPSLSPEHQAAHDIFKQLIEINTTDTPAGNVTAAAEAMAERFRAAGFPAEYLRVDPANFALLAQPEKQQPFEYLENGRVNKEQDDKCQDPVLGMFRLEIDTQPSENRAEDEWGQMLYQMSYVRHCA